MTTAGLAARLVLGIIGGAYLMFRFATDRDGPLTVADLAAAVVALQLTVVAWS